MILGEYHCWLAMDTTLMIGQYVPIVIMVVLTLTLIEAAGAAEYRKLPGIDQRQQTSAKIMQVNIAKLSQAQALTPNNLTTHPPLSSHGKKNLIFC